jgi:hypothetical protein
MFRLYRGANADFVPGPGNLVVATTDTRYDDVGPAGRYYKLAAVDRNGNESAFATLGPGQTTDVPATSAIAFALEGARPSPATGARMRVHFSLPSADPAKLELFDLSGRRVAERVVGSLGAGHHVVDLAQGHRLPAGLYLLRLTQGADARVARAAVLD